MEIGFNNDVDYRGSTFHIQTEDHGGGDLRVSTQLYFQGRVLDSKTVSYAHLLEGLEGEERKTKIRKVMVSAHRALYKKLFNGEYDGELGDVFSEPSPSEASGELKPTSMPTPEEFQPSQERVPDSAANPAQILEEDGKVTFTFDSGEAMDLRALSAQLNSIDVMPSGSSTDSGIAGFGELFEEFGDDISPAPPRNGAGRHPDLLAPPPLLRVNYASTGQRAFQGLIEPPPDLEAFDLVLGFLQRGG